MVRKPNGQPWFIHGVGFDISDLKRAQESLQLAHDELEIRVRDRTAELAKINAELETEITDRKRSQAELARQAVYLARSNADLEQFAYSASHDLQEPIRTLVLYSELLSSRYKDVLDERAGTLLKVLVDSATRMSNLIRDLLEYTRFAGDERPKSSADANQVLTVVIQNLETAIRENGAIITSERLPSVVGLPDLHLQQVLQNLILNAIKYRGEDVPRVHISAASRNGFWRFSVKDNGIGIPPEYHDQIFGIFKRLDHRAKSGGTGMGLAICKRILERAEGHIWVESEAGKGSNFLFTVPITSVEKERDLPPR
jgi:light-regulated signal transduction histidine kinase (bacteriophytochrome)